LETLRYYANAVLKSELFQLSRQNDEIRYLHLLAFIASQTFRYQDAVVDSFLQTVQNITNSATQELRDKIFRERREKRSTLRSFAETVQTDVFEPLVSVDEIVASGRFPTDEKIVKIKAVLLNFHASRPMVENRMSEMLAETDSTSDDSEFYNVLQQKSLTLQKRTADIIRLLQVNEKTVNEDLFDALQHFQINDGHLDGRASSANFCRKKNKMQLIPMRKNFLFHSTNFCFFKRSPAVSNPGQSILRLRTNTDPWKII